MWVLYNMLFCFGYLVMLPHFLMRMARRGGYRQDFGERFGRYGAEKLLALEKPGRIWIHAVSVGEAQLALALMQALRQEDETLSFVVSTTTSTGYAFLAARKQERDVQIYYPLDFPWIIRRVLRTIRPRAFLLLECELWPNLLRGLARRGVPVWVVNGRISERSYRGYRKVSVFFRRAAAFVTGFLVQTEADAERLRLLGAERVQVLGSAKFDIPVPGSAEQERARSIVARAGMCREGMFWVMGSTWPGEEEKLLDIFARLRAIYPDLQAILVPRHAERGDALASLLNRSGIPYVRRSALPDVPGSTAPALLLADSTGELAGYYMLADFVFVGKSMAGNHGGQNPVEPASLGKPVAVGDCMENFLGVMVDFEAADAICVVRTFAELEAFCRNCIRDASFRSGLGERARKLVDARRGVMRKSAQRILQHLAESKS
jgi:3-deoxy-D-manno-octulosonic-acid transferase